MYPSFVDDLDRVGVRELRADLARWVRRAGAGERVVVTVDGRPVAQLVGLDAPGGEVTFDDLAARGLLTLAARADRPEPSFVLPTWAGTRLDQVVREIRGR